MPLIKEIFNLYLDKSDFFIELIGQHIIISVISILIASIIGVSLGILISENEKLASPIIGVTNFLYTIPSIAILGFLVSISGVGNTTAIITLIVYALLPMVTSTHTGIKNIDERTIESAVGMGSTRFQILYKIKLPLALPVIFSGFRNMVIMTIALAGIASFIGAGGLGVAIWRGITTNNSAMTIAGSLLIALIALVTDTILRKIEKYINYRVTGKRRKILRINNIIRKYTKPIIVIAIIILIVLGSIFVPKIFKKDKKIVIASKPMTEQYILTEMLAQLIEEKTDINVEIKKGIGGGTANIHPAMLKGEIDMYPEYTGTSWEYILKKKSRIEDPIKLYEEVKKGYKENYDLNWLGLYGYNSTYAIVINKDIADKYNINTYSDLAKVSDKLVFGAEYDFFEREDGYNALAEKYGFKFKNKLDLDIGLKYQGLESKKVDVINASTTDAKLKDDQYKVLIDDKGFFPSYLAGTVIREETLKDYPELKDVIKLLDNNIKEDDIVKMNYEVEVDKKDDNTVAREFLINKGLVK
ncbi:ABC transporter permease/substrate-binding protein [Clostridium sp. CCUG 7971]|uniref:ABC transporter permease/substrate-binding protein n=1 Tax=Clostridium sp. CCUG 7971 TaxID=2811414 RepID=UPI001ABBD0D0|nr:ABC transporter permease/substrate-binding protein [Clostridium sp. CCUG 7971]MBO3444519.1 ABC transporter permease/substrate-binding protein [Clostridium sp. CCUG 7971]